MEETAPQILTKTAKSMKAWVGYGMCGVYVWAEKLQKRIHLQNQELERQHDYTNMYLLKTMSWADMQKSKRPRENESEKWKWSRSVLRLFVTPWNVAYQAPLSMGFSRQEYWSGLPFPSSGDLPNPGIKLWSPALQADALPSELPGKMGRYESGASSKGSAQVHACMQPCAPSLIHQYWLNSLLCAGHRTRLWNTMETKPEFLLSWCLCISGRDGHWSSDCTNFGNIVTMRGPIKEYMTQWEEITERLAQPEKSEKLPWTSDLTDVSIEWSDINWVKKGEKSILGRQVHIQALGGRFEDWKKAKCG